MEGAHLYLYVTFVLGSINIPCPQFLIDYVCMCVLLCAHMQACVKQLPLAALSCLTRAHKNPISSQRGDSKGAVHTNTAATHTHTQYTAPIGRYYSEHR